eukprot:6228393-Amphidinium_carterae.1
MVNQNHSKCSRSSVRSGPRSHIQALNSSEGFLGLLIDCSLCRLSIGSNEATASTMPYELSATESSSMYAAQSAIASVQMAPD